MIPTRLFDFIEFEAEKNPLNKAFSTKYNGDWERISSEEFCKKISSYC